MTKMSVFTSIGVFLSLSGQALGQTFDQGTITRQRTPLTTYAPSTQGWLSESTTPRFWTWKLAPPITPGSETSPYMQEWIHALLDTDIVDSTCTIDGTQVISLANTIGNQIISRGLQDGEYAIFLQNWVWRTRLAQAVPDELALPLNSNGDPFNHPNGWPTQSYGRNLGNTGTPWRETGLSYTYGEYLAEAIIAYIETYVMSNGSYTSFPKPSRVFFDEEFAFSSQCGINPIAAMTSLVGDSRFTTENLYGNFSLWDPTPAATTASELFSSAWFCDLPSWLPSTFDVYPYNDPCNSDWGYPPMLGRYGDMLTSARDGLIEASFGKAIKNAWGSGVLWSNYSTSGWYVDSYPRIGKDIRGARHWSQRANPRYGFSQATGFGSSDMHAMVLYPPHPDHAYDACPDVPGGCPGGVAPETHALAWLRDARMWLDHSIFSFDEVDAIGYQDSPKHFAPWVTAVGTYVSYPSGGSYSLTTKENVRNIVALCKSRGVNELVFWADPNSWCSQWSGNTCVQHNGTAANAAWRSTNDVLSQVYDYELASVTVNSGTVSSTDLDAMRFGEEYTYDLDPTVIGTLKFGALVAEFSVAPLTTPGESYALITEVLDGGGPWVGASYSLKIFNFDTNTYETISASPTELLSTSTRRAEFYDIDSDGFADGFSRVFDDETDLPSGSSVVDRKTINRWDFSIPMGSASVEDYFSPITGNMRFEIVAFHTAAVPSGGTPDPYRIDLLQLFETDEADDNLPYPESRAADLNNDGVVDIDDLAAFALNNAKADLNGDGEIDHKDLEILVNEFCNR